jgi:hypothetical protein
MRFHYRRTERDSESFFHEALFLDEQKKIVLALQVEQNTVEAWGAGLRKMRDAHHHPYYKNLLNKIDDLERCDYDDLPTLWRIIFALRQIVKKERNEAAAETLTACLRKWFSFEAEYNKAAGAYQYLVYTGGEKIFLKRHLLAKDRPAPKSIPAYLFSADIADLQKQHPEKFDSLLQNYERLLEASTYHRAAEPERKEFILYSFANFSKALIEFLDKNETVNVSTKTMNTILGVAIKDENARLDDQQAYLGRVVESRENERGKYERLKDIAIDVRDDVRGKRGEESRLVSILGAISAYYLRRYDFERAIEFWNLLDKKDWLLRQILKLYGATTWKYAAIAIVMGAATTAPLLKGLYPFSIPAQNIFSNLPLVVLFPALAAIPFFTVFVLYRFFVTKKGPEYIELFFPRLLGAIIVGLSVLLFQDTSWKFGMQLSFLNLTLICLAVYPMALLYIFINVHKELRYLPYDDVASKDKQNSTMKHSIKVSLKIFSIGLLESFFAVLITSALLYKGVFTEQDICKFTHMGLAMTWNINGVLIGFFPTLIFLWTGLSLLIGAFAQLLWQDKQITST